MLEKASLEPVKLPKSNCIRETWPSHILEISNVFSSRHQLLWLFLHVVLKELCYIILPTEFLSFIHCHSSFLTSYVHLRWTKRSYKQQECTNPTHFFLNKLCFRFIYSTFSQWFFGQIFFCTYYFSFNLSLDVFVTTFCYPSFNDHLFPWTRFIGWTTF